ncbi:MAG: MltA domain-containing protein [Alphaproteobacteria bacterium]|nr:MltA domain-containing protein [Alphaproteobacteria bacterium]
MMSRFVSLNRLAQSLAVGLVLGLTLAGCDSQEETKAPEPEPTEQTAQPDGMVLTPAAFTDLPGWQNDDMVGTVQAVWRSCTRLLALKPDKDVGSGSLQSVASDWVQACTALDALKAEQNPDLIRSFFETYFQPFAAKDAADGEATDADQGLFTGYFEAELHGSRVKDETFKTPLYARPEDLITVDLGQFDEKLKGKGVVGQVQNGRLVPYLERGPIEAGALAGRGLELLWIDDPVDVFLLQVQGSGRVILPDGNVVQVGFAAHNGRGYQSIGRWLIDQGELKAHEASWDGIRGWIEKHPDRASDLFAYNPRFIFFRLLDGDGPIGAEGVALTPERSMAVDTRYIPLGMPLWLDTVRPGGSKEPMQRLMVAQDKGGAIKGVVRGDFFWGYGDKALAEAGRMKSSGRYFLLLPNPLADRVKATS